MLDQKNQETLKRYYEHTNTGDFSGALRFFAEDAVYRLPAASEVVPYAGTWHGKDGVRKVFQAFGEAFALVDMTELCTISTQNEFVSINDEIFVSKAGQAWRVGVAHQFTFRDGLINSLDVHLDLGAAHEALSGRTVLESALLPVTAGSAKASVTDGKVQEVVTTFLRGGSDTGELLAPEAATYVPGDTRRLRFAGTWLGRTQVQQMHTNWSNSFDGSIEPVRIITDHGNAFVMAHAKGNFTPTRAAIGQPICIFFQLDDNEQIVRMFWYLNTYPFVAIRR